MVLTARRYVITVANEGSQEHQAQTFDCGADQSLLKGMERYGNRAIPVGCRGGGCGLCKVRIIAGEFDAGKMSLAKVSEQQRSEGFALACRVFPRSDMSIEVVQNKRESPGLANVAKQRWR